MDELEIHNENTLENLSAAKPEASSGGRGEEARRRLVMAGLEIFGRYGYEAASTRQIAQRAGVNLAAITYHFGSKEGLYHAVARQIGEFIDSPIAAARDHIETALTRDNLTYSECLELLQTLLVTLAQSLLTMDSERTGHFILTFIREQIDPTPAFDILYQGVTAKVLPQCARLIARMLGKPEDDPECRLRVITLIGQVLMFRLARRAVLRAMEWDDYTPEQVETICSIIRSNIAAIFAPYEHGH